MAETRKKNWCFIVYPESAPTDWIKQLDDMHIQGYISPLHDRDIEDDGYTPKKPHYHVLIKFTASIGYHAALDKFNFLELKYIKPIDSFPPMARYLCHLDHKEKAQYNPDDVIALGGMPNYWSEYIDGNYNKYQTISDILDFIREESVGLLSFSDLLTYARIHHELNWYNCILDNVYLIRTLISEYQTNRRDAMIYISDDCLDPDEVAYNEFINSSSRDIDLDFNL